MVLPDLQKTGDDIPAVFRRTVHEHWRTFMAEGVLLILLGALALAIPLFASLAVTIVLGWLFLIAGIGGLIATLRARRAPMFGWSLMSAGVTLIAGLVLLWDPVAGLVTLTYVLTVYFVADGVFSIAQALSHRRELSGRWEWMVVSGVVDFVLAAAIISGMPGSFLWVVGLLVGIDLMIGGISLVAMASVARRAD